MPITIDGTNGITQAGEFNSDSSFGFKNRIINGGMDIAQRGTSFTSGANNNDAYVLDRFYILSDGNDAIDVTQTTTVPTGAKFSIGLDVETTNKKFGIAQIIENANCFDAIGGAVTLSFQAKVSATTKLDNVKCAIVAWSGTADSVTSDIISAWNVEGTNPTLIANATYENTPANLNVTTSFATYSVTANVDTASTSNIIVFIWSDVTDTTAGDFLYVTNIQLEKGSTATSFDYRSIGQETSLCQRYFEKSYNMDVVPATNTGAGRVFVTALYQSAGLLDYGGSVSFRVSKRANPTMAYFREDGTSGSWDWATDAGSGTVTAILTNRVGTTAFSTYATGSGFSNTSFVISGHWTASSEL
jgi:hypothetical protein